MKVKNPPSELANLLELANRLFTQERGDKQKLYSVHEPQVECIGKGKAHKKFEFGTKVGLVTTAKTNWIVGAEAYPGNPYDGHTLKSALSQTAKILGHSGKNLFKPNLGKYIVGIKIEIVFIDKEIETGAGVSPDEKFIKMVILKFNGIKYGKMQSSEIYPGIDFYIFCTWFFGISTSYQFDFQRPDHIYILCNYSLKFNLQVLCCCRHTIDEAPLLLSNFQNRTKLGEVLSNLKVL